MLRYLDNAENVNTHPNENYARLLRELGDALSVFLADLKGKGLLDRVAVMVFSEFGRRVEENASGGTDHGAAGPVFLAGGPVRAGLHGKRPSLRRLHRGDLAFEVDFRRVYATVLEEWLGHDSRALLGRSFPLLDLFRA